MTSGFSTFGNRDSGGINAVKDCNFNNGIGVVSCTVLNVHFSKLGYEFFSLDVIMKIKPLLQASIEKKKNVGMFAIYAGVVNNNEYLIDAAIGISVWCLSLSMGITIIKGHKK